MYEFIVSQTSLVMVDCSLGIRISQPNFPVVSFPLIKNQIDSRVILNPFVDEVQPVFSQRAEILLSLFVSLGTETFVILDFPFFDVIAERLCPKIKILQCKEA